MSGGSSATRRSASSTATRRRAAAYRATRRGFLVTNYEQVLRDLDLIQRWKADLVVLDEAQRIKNWATKTAAYVKALRPAYRLVLIGTPMENRLEELASLLDWVDDMALEPKWRLLPAHAEYADGRPEVVGANRLGQKLPIDVYNLVTEASIEARIAGLLADKQALFSGLFDGESNEVRLERSSSFLSRLEHLGTPARAPEPAMEESPEEQGSAEHEVERLVAAADEGRPAPGEPPPPTFPEEPPVAAAPGDEVRGPLAALTIRRRDDGGLTLEAPPEAADGLAALFEGMGRLLREAGVGR